MGRDIKSIQPPVFRLDQGSPRSCQASNSRSKKLQELKSFYFVISK